MRALEHTTEHEPPQSSPSHAATLPDCLRDVEAAAERLARGEYTPCIEVATRAYDVAVDLGRQDLAARASLTLGRAYANLENRSRGMVWADRALAAAEQAGLPDIQAMALALKGTLQVKLGTTRAAVTCLHRAATLLEGVDDQETARSVNVGMGLAYLGMGMPLQAITPLRRAMGLRRGVPLGTRLRLHVILIYALVDAHDVLAVAAPQEAQALATQMSKLVEALRLGSEKLPTVVTQASYLHAASQAMRTLGQPAEACRLLLELDGLLPQLPDHMQRELLVDIALAQKAVGDLEGAAASARRASLATRPKVSGDPAMELRLEYRLALAQDDPLHALEMQRRFHACVVRNHHEAMEARVADLTATVAHLTLRQENTDLRKRNEKLNSHVRRVDHLASTDPLTGVANRRGLEADYEALRSSGDTMSLLLLDLDHFKLINDRFSHMTGDNVLRHVASILRATLRDDDRTGRFGGEEFVVLLPKTEGEGLAIAAERVRHAVEAAPWADLAPELRVTLSVGGVVIATGESLESALGRADSLLYQAKAQGRNRALVSRSAPEEGAPPSTPDHNA
jgi:diguanylate cyclase (GGDEF)-like protein